MTVEYASAFSRRLSPELCQKLPALDKRGRRRPSREGAGKTGCALHPRSHVHVCAFAKSAHEHTGSAENIRPPLRNGVTTYIVLSPVSRACLPPSLCEIIPHNLTPASGRQDHTILPSASRAVRQKRIRVHRIPGPTFVTMANAPLCGPGRKG